MRRRRAAHFFRRGTAACAAGLTAWVLLTWPVVRGAAPDVGGAEFVTAALRAELGQPDSALTFWQRLAVAQSPLLEHSLPEGEPEATATPEPLPDAQPAPDRDEQAQGEASGGGAGTGAVVERTLVPTTAQGYVTGAGLYLYNRTGLTVDLTGAAQRELDFTLRPAEEGPQVLLIHTHTTEAYTPAGEEDAYLPSDENTRTLDAAHNMLRVGDEMEKVLTGMGLNVLHDRGVYDYPRYAGAYDRSREAVEGYLEQYPTLRVVLDLHRDALVGSDGTVYKACTDIDTVKTAQVMLVVGTDEAGGHHPDWEKNLALAARVQRSLDTLYPTLARPMALRRSAYNQQLSAGSLLVEVGCHGNSLAEALAGARDLARGTGAVLLSLVE